VSYVLRALRENSILYLTNPSEKTEIKDTTPYRVVNLFIKMADIDTQLMIHAAAAQCVQRAASNSYEINSFSYYTPTYTPTETYPYTPLTRFIGSQPRSPRA
jgi:hypothetical protein